MNKLEFTACVIKKLSEYGTPKVKLMQRSNVSYTGAFIPAKCGVSPVINIDRLFADYCAGVSIDQCIGYIDDVMCSNIDSDISNAKKIVVWEWAQNKLYFRLFNTPISDVFVKVADLYLIPYVQVTSDDSAAVKVTKELIDIWGVTSEKVLELAGSCQETLRPAKVRHILDCLGAGLHIEDADADPVYVVTVDSDHYGAVAILYSDVAEQIHDIFGEDFYILPSSVHEVIVIPRTAINDTSDLLEVVKVTNHQVIDDCERLSDAIYSYDFEHHTISPVA